jgi:hypothetical protein
MYPTCPPIQSVPGGIPLRVNQLGHEADHSPLSAEVKNTRIHTSTLIHLDGVVFNEAQGQLHQYVLPLTVFVFAVLQGNHHW